MPRPEAVRAAEASGMLTAHCLRLKEKRKLSLRVSEVARRAREASPTTRRSAAVLRETEKMPSVANWRKMWPRSGAMNCGMKDRKKRAVLGLRASVKMP